MLISIDIKQDLVAIIAPASGGDTAHLNLTQVQNLLRQHSFNSHVSKDILKSDCLAFFAASMVLRKQDLKNALENAKVKIIIGIRGGYGSSEIVFDLLNIKPSSNKIFIGFSDCTIIHALFNQYYNLPSIHGAANDLSFADIVEILQGKTKIYDLSKLSTIENEPINSSVVGGNLTIVGTTIGTKLQLQTKDKILLLEDVSEPGYKVHRNLMHLKNAGLLEKVKAILISDFTKSDDYVQGAIEQFITHHVPHLPVYRIKDIGHGEKNKPIVFNSPATIIDNKLTVQSPFKCI